MKLTVFRQVLIFASVILTACKKEPPSNKPLASITIVNAVMGGGAMKVNTLARDSVRNFNAKSLGLALVNGQVSIKVWPSLESGKSYYNEDFDAKEGDLYSLLIFGWPGAVESLLAKEQVPGSYVDSVLGVRIAHCAPGSGTINVNLQSDTTVSLVSQVNYKSLSKIVKVPLPSVIPTGGVSFEVRDGLDNKLLTTYTLPVNVNSMYPGISIALQRFKNITLVLKGSRDTLSGPNSVGVFPVAMSY